MYSDTFASDYLKTDYQRLELLFNALIGSIKSEEPLEYQQSLFHLFKSGLLKRLHWEETILFPVYKNLVGDECNHAKLMLKEHVELASMILELEKSQSLGFDEDYLLALSHYLDGHNDKELKVLYPAIDHVCKGDDQEKIAIAISQGYR